MTEKEKNPSIWRAVRCKFASIVFKGSMRAEKKKNLVTYQPVSISGQENSRSSSPATNRESKEGNVAEKKTLKMGKATS